MQNLLPNNKPYLIYVSLCVKEKEEKIISMITSRLKNIVVKSFDYRNEFPSDFNQSDLIIVDVISNKDKLEEIHKKLVYNNLKTTIPYLISIDYTKFKYKDFDVFQKYPDIIFDVYDNNSFNEFAFINRIKCLLSIPRIRKISNIEMEKIQTNIWKLLDYLNMFILVLNKDFVIKIGNFHLARTLGYNDENDLIGLSFEKFIKSNDVELIKHVQTEILNGSESYKEFTFDILDKDYKTITVKWFNMKINGEFNCVFSIGLPLTKEPTLDEDIDSVRAYFRDILEQDKTTINAMKEITMKNANKMLRKVECNNVL